MVAPRQRLAGALSEAYPELALIEEAAAGVPVFVVGGAVRDLLLGRERADLDLVVVGDLEPLVARLDGEPTHHERFATASILLGEHRVDLATARTETYPAPGALPAVEPAPDIESDLSRRDFTVNAMAVPLSAEPALIDPHGGLEDLDEGTLRVLHSRSLSDDPTRAVRAARYAARFGLVPEPETLAQIENVDLRTISDDRRDAELLRLAAEPDAVAALGRLAEWGVVRPEAGGLELAARIDELLRAAPWAGYVPRDRALLVAALGPRPDLGDLTGPAPARPSEAVARASGADPIALAIARAQGAHWLDRHLAEWSRVSLQIRGEDLIDAGVPQGRRIGRGLEEALRRKLDGEIEGREAELAVALEAARDGD